MYSPGSVACLLGYTDLATLYKDAQSLICFDERMYFGNNMDREMCLHKDNKDKGD